MKPKTKYEEHISKVDPSILNEWKAQQDLLKTKLIEVDQLDFTFDSKVSSSLKLIGGMDISASIANPDIAVAALVVCNAETLEVLYEKYEFVTMTQPYVPGFLAFREVDHLLKLINDLRNSKPDLVPQVILIDGNGILHSNRFGLACHLGVLSGIPTIGCGKTVFSVDGISKKGVQSGAKTMKSAGEYLYLKGVSGAIWGAALRCTTDSTVPIIVSIGHKVSLDTALKIVIGTTKFRVPEPVRIADKRSRVVIKEYEKNLTTFDIEKYFVKLNENVKHDMNDDDD